MRGATQAVMFVTLVETEDGMPRPYIDARFPAGSSQRVARATVLRLAAEVELATPAHEGWAVAIEEPIHHCRLHYRVALELAEGEPDEVARAIAVLRRVVPS